MLARFDPETEARFREHRIERALPTIRFGCMGACIIFAAFFLRDRYLHADERLTLTLRVIACVFYLSLIPLLGVKRFRPSIPAFAPVGAGVGALCVSLLCVVVPHGFDIGIGGPLLVIMAAPAVAPSAWSAVVTCITCVMIPNIAMLASHQPWITRFSSNHYLILGALLSIGIAVLFESDARSAFQLELDLEKAATTDPLTGIFNRRRFLELADSEVARARRYGHALSVVMLDLDHFKQINDRFGHMGGDSVLKVLPSRLDVYLRRNDVLGRIGGEEFAIVLPESDRGAAAAAAERLRAALASQTIPLGSAAVTLTVSAGCAELSADDADFEALLKRADLALYAAKRAGRNCVEVG